MSIERSVKRGERRQELDRDQWAELDKVGYRVTARGNGEAISGPYWFGRAFDAPPFFTFSAVSSRSEITQPIQITVGVAEWLRDQQGMYVGANLFFVFGVDLEGNCIDAVRRGGSNVLLDPGFERQHSVYGTGPHLDNEIPAFDPRLGFAGVPFRWCDGPIVTGLEPFETPEAFTPPHADNFGFNDPVAGNHSFWVADWSNQVDGRRWLLSRENPRTGDWHARKIMTTAVDNGGGAVNGHLFAWQFTRCKPPGDGSASDTYTAGVRPGDHVKWFFHIMASHTASMAQVDFTLDFLKADWQYTDTGIAWVDDRQIPTQYVRMEIEATAPPEAVAVEAYLMVHHDRSQIVTVDVDDAGLEITGSAGQSEDALPLSFDVALSFEGKILKGYSNIHMLHAYEAPVEVVLS